MTVILILRSIATPQIVQYVEKVEVARGEFGNVVLECTGIPPVVYSTDDIIKLEIIP